MLTLLTALALLILSGCAALCNFRSSVWSTRFGVGGVIMSSALGLIPTISVLLGSPALSLHLPWAVPYGSFAVELDALSAFFLLPIFLLSAAAALYGSEYLQTYREKKSLGASWFFFNILVASMALVVIARNGVLFLVAWEMMALASFFLVTFEHEQATVQEAGWTYLVATHLGAACVMVLFLLLGRQSGSLDFTGFTAPPAMASLLFFLAVVGFGSKAGIMPFHVWLPEAHPAAPSHVSALMSGVMIKTGIYGLLRVLTFLGPPPAWWGWLLCSLGLLSGVLGILFALAQHDLKRLLAYSSVENIGIITLGLGMGLIGMSTASPMLMILGFGGGLLHLLNHAFIKGLLFLGAGAIIHATGTRDLNHLGGLLKSMPWTGSAFLFGAVAITGLPPFNGFLSEFLIYLGALRGMQSFGGVTAVTLLGVIAGLALIGGLAAACFAKAVGAAFLGEPRSHEEPHWHEPGQAMRWSLFSLVIGCVLISLCAPMILVHILAPVLNITTHLPAPVVQTILAQTSETLATLVLITFLLVLLIALLAGVRHWLLSGRTVTQEVTWDCGYAQPTSHMQYTASSFIQPLTERLASLLRSQREVSPPQGFFPSDASLRTETSDLSRRYIFQPLFTGISRSLGSLRWLQQGQMQLYVLYIALTLLALLMWRLG